MIVRSREATLYIYQSEECRRLYIWTFEGQILTGRAAKTFYVIVASQLQREKK